MTYKIAIYCPDKHISYDLNTLNQVGVGGGITARVRFAHALARRGHKVQLFVNCPKEGNISGVDYIHFTNFSDLDSDIFIASTTGDSLDLSNLINYKIQSKLKILFIDGDIQPKGIDTICFDYIYSPSNYLAQTVSKTWCIEPKKFFVTHHGVENNLFEQMEECKVNRDDYKLIYTGHPSKGLDAAVSVLKILRAYNSQFSLHIYGGYRMWGQDLDLNVDEPGVFFYGLIGQQELTKKLMSSGFSINLQSREEPFGMVVTDSMRAGCVVLGSPVGAYRELIQDRINGFIIPGIHTDTNTHSAAAAKIIELVSKPRFLKSIRNNAIRSPLSWDTIASTAEGHWEWNIRSFFTPKQGSKITRISCPICNGKTLLLADGLHCIDCGYYFKKSTPLFLPRFQRKGVQ